MTNPASATVDAFHRGKFVTVQPISSGHRSGIDAMLIAAAVPNGFAGAVADFGSGAGAAGLAVAARCGAAHITLVERDPAMVAFAGMTIAHPGNAHLADRLSVIEADLSQMGKTRVDSGLCDRSFDFVIMNPPFNAASDRATSDPLKASAHVMEKDMFESWLRTAAAVLRPRGFLAMIARPQSLQEILQACDGRFGALQILPVLPRSDEAAIRIIVRGIRTSRAPLSLLPPLILHGATGNAYETDADATINGLRPLFDNPLRRGK